LPINNLEELFLMKKTVKNSGKTPVKGKTTPKPRKKAGTTVRNSRKRGMKKYSDAMKALMMVGVLVALSAAISLVVINFISISGDEEEETESQSIVIETIQEKAPAPQTSTVSLVPEQKPAQQKPQTTPERTTPPRNTTPERTATPSRTTAPETKPAATTTPAASTPQRVTENKGTLVFIIDDAGNNLRELDPFLRIPGPLTIAVLPGLPHSAEAARRIRAAGKEVFLHQPMEALGGQNPGPNAIYSNMNANEIRAILKRNVDEIGPIAGMNNHQGSKITMDKEIMQTVLTFCKENSLHFIDSRTTSDTVVPDVARFLGLKIAERNVFLDNDQDRESMQRSLNTAVERAARQGSAVMIGHTWSPQLAPLLSERYSELTKQGYTIKTASEFIK
jgi:polysaccharide deacetylase 2 family uncharacterized protein YibQ